MTASSPRPAGSRRYAQCTDDCTTDCGACKGARRPTAPDTTGGELRDVDWWTRLFLASSEAIDSVPYAAGHEYPVPHAAAFRSAVEPALRDLIAERDTLAAQVQAVEGLCRAWETVAQPASTDTKVYTLRRALGTPTTGGGQ